MYRTIGAMLLGCCTLSFGAGLSEKLKGRLRTVTALRDALLRMEQKVCFYRQPLPDLLRTVAVEQGDLLSPSWLRAADRLERNPRKPADKLLLDCLLRDHGEILPAEAKACCCRLFSAMGASDADHQEQQFRRAIGELDTLETRLREDLARKNRCFWALGLCGGLAVTILLV